jgi:hypothetical protein
MGYQNQLTTHTSQWWYLHTVILFYTVKLLSKRKHYLKSNIISTQQTQPEPQRTTMKKRFLAELTRRRESNTKAKSRTNETQFPSASKIKYEQYERKSTTQSWGRGRGHVKVADHGYRGVLRPWCAPGGGASSVWKTLTALVPGFLFCFSECEWDPDGCIGCGKARPTRLWWLGPIDPPLGPTRWSQHFWAVSKYQSIYSTI